MLRQMFCKIQYFVLRNAAVLNFIPTFQHPGEGGNLALVLSLSLSISDVRDKFIRTHLMNDVLPYISEFLFR